MIPGEIIPGEGPVVLNAGRPVRAMVVVNTGDRPVQAASTRSHFVPEPALENGLAAARARPPARPGGRSIRPRQG